MNELLTHCRWPDLEQPYAQALRDATVYILDNFEVLGIIASGTIIRGKPDPTSDLDIYVVHAKPERQMIQKFFNRIPAQIFLNPPHRIPQYFVEESREGRPITAHMLATGFVVFDNHPIVNDLRHQATTVLAEGSTPLEDQLNFHRYNAADRFENVLDVADSDPVTANMLLNLVVYEMLHYYFLKQRLFMPRDKDLLKAVSQHHPVLGQISRDFYQAEKLDQRLTFAQQIADITIETRGFFEWQTQRELVEG
jgi:hypothetical protein